jgi:hypothetical protein
MIVITMDGGLIQSVCSDDPGIQEVVIIDYDVEGREEPVVKPFGAECRVMTYGVDKMDVYDVHAIEEAARQQGDLDEAFITRGKEEVNNG